MAKELTKVCTKCGKEKPISEFYKERRGLYGVRADCKLCNNAKCRHYYGEHSDERKAAVRQWEVDNPEAKRRLKRIHCKRRSEHIVDRVRRWRENNPEKRRQQALIDEQRRRARVLNAPGNGISQENIVAMFERDNWCCLACGAIDNLTVDHIIPISKGGEHDSSNIQTLCGKCNSSKGTMIIDYRKQE